jgi:hypothetical protein
VTAPGARGCAARIRGISISTRGKKFRFSLDVIAKARGEQPPRTKGDAEALADRIRSEIRAGTFRDPHQPEAASAPDPTALLTVGDIIDTYTTRHVKSPTRRASAQKTMLWHLGVLRRTEIPAAHGQHIRFERKPFKDVTKADIEAIRDARRREQIEAVSAREQWERCAQAGTDDGLAEAASAPGCGRRRNRHQPTTGASAASLRMGYRGRFCRFDAIQTRRSSRRKAYERNAAGPPTGRVSRPRTTRRGDRLLRSAGPHLRDLIIAGIATGCRVGELLALQWKDVRVTTGTKGLARQSLVLPAGKTKTNTTREVPVGPRLAAVLDLRRHAPDGTRLGPDAYVFGNEVGERSGRSRRRGRPPS